MNLADRIRSGITVSASGCWEWNGCIQGNGYGRLRSSGRSMGVHRAAYIAFIGPIPNVKDVCHRCDNRACCNPEHLFLGSRMDNMKDAKAKGRLSAGKRHSDLICGEKGGGAKLKVGQVKAIRELEKRGLPLKDLASVAGVGVDAIRLIVNGKTWKDIEQCAE